MSAPRIESGAGWTPGPWKVADIHANGFYGNNGEAMVSAEDRRICAVDCATAFKRGQGYTHVCAERDANARLIAAAPELVEALRAIVPFADDFTASGCEAIRNARALLARIEGDKA